MEDVNIASLSVGSLIAVMGAVLSYAGYIRSKSKDQQQRAAELATIKERIESLDREITDVKEDIKDKDTDMKNKIDKLDNKFDKLNDMMINFVSNFNINKK